MTLHCRAATSAEDSILAIHFYQMWRDLDIPVTHIHPSWHPIVTDFIAEARERWQFQAFVAETPEGKLIGSASCQQFAGLYPLVLASTYQKRGYIWGVFVAEPYRRQGIASQLMRLTINYLKAIGCTHALLNASPIGQPLYESLGFEPGNLMTLSLQS